MAFDRASLNISQAVDEQLGRIVEAAVEGLQSGEAINLNELVAAHPEYERELNELLPAIEMLVRMGKASDSQKRTTDPAEVLPSPREQLGDFHILREIGRGGMGIVYEAEQISLRRRVALKVLPLASMLAPEPLARFQIESQAAGALRHPNIVPVFAVGCARGMHFYAMQFIEGRTLAEIIEELRRQPPRPIGETSGRLPLSQDDTQGDRERTVPGYATTSYFRAVARIGTEVAEALDHAHSLGIVHRDIKPSNLLVDNLTTVYVTDFGLAQVAGSEALTRTGELIGTLRYMSPEQAAGREEIADCRSDIYSLGATLYELITLQPPCASAERHALLRQILTDEPLPLRRFQPQVPRDLETIVLKALRKDPAERYSSARQLAEDLRSFQCNRPIMARPRSTVDRILKWSVRNPTFIGSIAVAILIALGALLISNQIIRRSWRLELAARSEAESARAQSDEQRRLAEERLALARRTSFDLQLAQVRDIWRTDSRRAQQLLEDADLCPPELRDFTWRLYRRLCGRELATLSGHDGPVKDAVYFPAHGVVASAGADGAIRIWNSATRKQYLRCDGHKDVVSSLDVSPDQQLFASASHDGTVRVWRIEDADRNPAVVEKFVLQSGTGPVIDLCFSPDGRTLACGEMNSTVRLWDVTDGTESSVLLAPTRSRSDRIMKLAYSRSGKFLAGCADGMQIWIWDSTQQKPIASIDTISSFACAAFAPDETTIAVGDHHEIVLQNWKTKEVLAKLPGHEGENISAMAFSPDGDQLISTGFDGCMRTWDIRSNNAKSILTGHTDRINSLHLAPEEGIVTTASYDGTAKLWKIDKALEERTILGDEAAVKSLAFSPTELLLASAGNDGNVKLWRAIDGKLIGSLVGHGPEVCAVTISPDGSLVATAGVDKAVRLWDRRTCRELDVLDGHDDVVSVLEFSPDGRLLASAGRDKVIQLWNVETRQPLRKLSGHTDKIWALDFSPDGTQLVSAGRDGTIRLWNPLTGKAREVLHEPNGSGVGSCVFSSDGGTLATATSRMSDEGRHNGTIHLWDVPTFKIRKILQGHADEVFSLAFSPDGQTLASSSRDRIIRLWDPQTGQERTSLSGHPSWVYCVVFSHDGSFLASAGAEGEIKIWNGAALKTAAPIPKQSTDHSADESFRTLQGHTHGILSMDLNASQNLLASGSHNGSVYVWETASGECRRSWAAHVDKVAAVDFSPNGRLLVTAGVDGAARVWNVRTGDKIADVSKDGARATGRFSPDGKLFVVAWQREEQIELGELAAHDVDSGDVRWRFAGPIYKVLGFSPDGKSIVTADRLSGTSCQISWRSVATGEQVANLPPNLGLISCCCFSPDGRVLAVCGHDPDRPIEIWNCVSQQRLHVLRGHKSDVSAVAISPSGRFVASGSLDHTIRICELQTGQLLKVFRGHIDGVTAVQFTADEKTLISGSRDHTIKFWNVGDIQ